MRRHAVVLAHTHTARVMQVAPPAAGGVHLGILRTPSPGVGLFPGRAGLPEASGLTGAGGVDAKVAGSFAAGVGAISVFLACPGGKSDQHNWLVTG